MGNPKKYLIKESGIFRCSLSSLIAKWFTSGFALLTLPCCLSFYSNCYSVGRKSDHKVNTGFLVLVCSPKSKTSVGL